MGVVRFVAVAIVVVVSAADVAVAVAVVVAVDVVCKISSSSLRSINSSSEFMGRELEVIVLALNSVMPVNSF